MDAGQILTEAAAERARASSRISTPHDVPIRSSGPSDSSRTFGADSSRTFGGSIRSSTNPGQDGSRSTPSEVWAGAISRVQTQVALNTSLLDSHRQKVQDIDVAVARLDQAVGNAMAVLHEVRAEQRARPVSDPTRHDPDDLLVLAERVGAISNRVNEVDSLRMQVRLLENRVKRWEEQGPPTVADTPGASTPVTREPSYRTSQGPSHYSLPSHPPSVPSQHQQLPPIRTSANMSPVGTRPTMHMSDPHQQSTESSVTMQASSSGGFRLGESLPPPSALPGWHSSESHVSSSTLPPPSQAGPSRGQTMHPETQASGWAAVNAAPSAKRPFEEPRQSPYQSSVPGSPKRPRLAPIMPRGPHNVESSYVPSSVPRSSATDTYRTHSRAPSDSSQSQMQAQTLPTPASANMPGHRFIVSTQSADSQESWRPDTDRLMHMQHPGRGQGPHGQGRRGGRGRGRGRGGRGGRGGVQLPPPEGQELGTPEWERADWTGSQVSPNGYYRPLHQQPHSPEEASRGGIVRRAGGSVGGPSDREAEFPATPLAVQGPYDPFGAAMGEGSGGKKSRSKPFRNAEGVLIRKDGRPDMRSVSSANNLRKVHAKKEAERAEMGGRTPTSARSLAPASEISGGEEDESRSGSPGSAAQREEEGMPTHTQERHRELMSRIFPSGMEDASRSAGERFFPPHEQRDTSEAEMKTEPESEEPSQSGDDDSRGASQMADVGAHQMPDVGATQMTDVRGAQSTDVGTSQGTKVGASQMTDVVMREMSEAQAEDNQQRAEHEDIKMPTVEEEVSEEQEQEQEQVFAGP